MLFRLRRSDGAVDAYSAGTYVDAQGRSRHLAEVDFTLTPGKIWTSWATGGRYPVEWTIVVPNLDFKAAVRTPLARQEITGSTNYWEGAIDIDSTRLGRQVSGVGYLEMTGYAGRIVGLD
jgi:predicted secreted hydrolase